MIGAVRLVCQAVVVRWVQAVERNAAWVVMAALLLTLLSIYYTVSHLAVDTDTANMIDPSLPFRQRQAEFERSFPQYNDLIVVVTDAATVEQAEDAANRLAAGLRQSGRFQSVRQPGQSPFFARHGLLYLESGELLDLSDQLAAAEPFLATLARDPSLRGLFSILGQALGQTLSPALQNLLNTSFERMADSVEALLAGRPQRLSWQQGLLGGLAEGSARRSFVLVQPRLDYASFQPGEQALAAIRQQVNALGLTASHGVRVRLTGSVAVNQEDLASVSASAKLATMLSFGLVCLLLLVGLGTPRLVAWILVTLFAGLVWTAAFATVTIGYLNLISVTFAVLFIGLGVDFSIQFGMRYREEFARLGDHVQALTVAASGLCGALLLAAGCAAVSFFCFMPTAYRGLAQLGLIAGCSMFIALLATLTVLPALLTLLPIRPGATRPVSIALPRWSFPIRYPRTVIWATVLIMAGSAVLLPRLHFDFDPINLSDPSTEAARTFHDLIADPDTTPYTIDVLAPDLEAAVALADRLDGLEEVVDKTLTLASFVPAHQNEKLAIIEDIKFLLAPVFSAESPKAEPSLSEQRAAMDEFLAALTKLGDAGQATAGLLTSAHRLRDTLIRFKAAPGEPDRLSNLQDSLLGNLPPLLHKLKQLLTAEPVSLSSLPEDLRADYITPDGRARLEVYPKQNMTDNRRLREFVAAVQAVAPTATGTPVSLLESGRVVMGACLQASISAMVAAFLVLAVALASAGQALLIILPLIIALLATVGLSVSLDLPLNFANVIALPLLLGIGVAFGIYLVLRQQSEPSLAQLFRGSTPRAVLFSGLTTMASFGTLAISRHRGMAGMGLLVTATLTFALAAALVVLPAVMAILEERRGRQAGPSRQGAWRSIAFFHWCRRRDDPS